MIKVEHLAKSFGTLQVLKDISLSINKGEVVTIIGPSGSGKSTLLRCLNLLERPDSGKIIFDGTDILSGKVKIESIRKNACMVFQHFNLFANMTALQNVAYAPRVVNGLSRADAEAKAQKLLEKVGLGDKSGQSLLFLGIVAPGIDNGTLPALVVPQHVAVHGEHVEVETVYLHGFYFFTICT